MKNRIATIIIALALAACVESEDYNTDSVDFRSTDSTESDTSTEGSDTGEPTETWCCWCGEKSLLCVDWEDNLQCEAVGNSLGVSTKPMECTGLPILGNLECGYNCGF